MDDRYMSLALSLAKRRKGLTHPNPTVGCVVVNNGEIVGIGYHERAGYPHAEVVALEQAGERAEGSTLYVTLEPCTHYGRTPPCTDAIIKAKVSRVVVATLDPNPLVGGKGVQSLREAGIEVEVGILEEDAYRLNEDFFTFISKKRPYVTLKLAQTLDGKIATLSGDSKWITSLESRRFAHRLRAQATAILVGITTVIKDDPQLTVRLIPFERQPLRVVIDPKLEVPLGSRILGEHPENTLVVYEEHNPGKEDILRELGVRLLRMEPIDLSSLLSFLAQELDILHLFVEGGAYTIGRFLKEGLWDRFVLFVAPKLMGSGISLAELGVEEASKSINLKLRREIRLSQDRVFEYVPVMERETLKW